MVLQDAAQDLIDATHSLQQQYQAIEASSPQDQVWDFDVSQSQSSNPKHTLDMFG